MEVLSRGRILAAALLVCAAVGESAADDGDGRDAVAAECVASPDAPRPQLEVRTLGGEAADWQSLQGRPSVIDVWATWCSACRATLKAADRLAHEIPSSRLSVIGLSVDRNGADAAGWLAETLPAARLKAWQAAPGAAFRALDIGSLPATLLLDSEGRVLASHAGSDPAELAALLAHARRCAR